MKRKFLVFQELFGAVGPLTSVKLDNCVAEVIFAKAVHAEIAYQKYHNRMLDGKQVKYCFDKPVYKLHQFTSFHLGSSYNN